MLADDGHIMVRVESRRKETGWRWRIDVKRNEGQQEQDRTYG